MHTLFLTQKITYDGSQLAPLYNYLQHGLLGDSMISWEGPCNIPFANMMDGEDLRDSATIAGDKMLHFIAEMFQFPLAAAVAFQRLMGERLIHEVHKLGASNVPLTRSGDDIYWGEKKFNISIATCSNTSSLIHFAVNVTNEGTPVKTCSLQDFRIDDSRAFAQSFMDTCKNEYMAIKRAMVKVRSF